MCAFFKKIFTILNASSIFFSLTPKKRFARNANMGDPAREEQQHADRLPHPSLEQWSVSSAGVSREPADNSNGSVSPA